MQYIISEIPVFEIVAGFSARMIHTDHVTIAFVDVTEGAILPEHSHFHEQVTTVLEGEFEIVVEGVPHRLLSGMSIVIPSHAKHSGRAITAFRAMDVFQPVREDYKIKG
jgi:quercetin dioxygenase-like cupin family protein